MPKSTAILIPLYGKRGTGRAMLVSLEDEEVATRYRWNVSPYGYAFRGAPTGDSGARTFHRLVMDRALSGTLPPGHYEEVDHINRNKLDNRRENLRLVPCHVNRRNVHRNPGIGSRYRGVVMRRTGMFRASIRVHGKITRLGQFTDETEAAHAYDEAARRMFGPGALVNFPE